MIARRVKGWRAKRAERPPVSPFIQHPFELAFGALFAILGFRLLTTTGVVTIAQQLPRPLVVAWATGLLLGGPLVIAGLLWPRNGFLGRAVERAGLHLGGSAWGVYALALVFLSRDSATILIPLGYALTLILACIGRIRALTRVDRVVERIAASARQED